MRSITKGAEPRELLAWKQKQVKSPQNLTYDSLPSHEREIVKTSLLEEQGYICAYTMRRIDKDNSHIEHIIPQNEEGAPHLDLEYANMAACFPLNGGDTSHKHGAPVKGGTPVTLNQNFVSPHSKNVERRFLYNATGEVGPASNDLAAAGTIHLVQLNGGQLPDLRRTALEAHGIVLRGTRTRRPVRPKSAAEARRFAADVLKPDGQGKLEPYCVALAQVALVYADREEARSKRIKGG